MHVTLLQEDLKWMLDNQPIADGHLLKYSGRHRLGTGGLRFLPLGAPTLADGQPVVDVGSQIIDSWFAADNQWTLPSPRNLARISKMFGLSWPEAFHFFLKLEWERFLVETHPVVKDGQSQSEIIRLMPENEPLPRVVKSNALPLRNWPVRTFQRLDGNVGNVERYAELVDEFCESWLGEHIADIQKEVAAVLPNGLDARAFVPPGSRRQAGHCYYIFVDFIIHHDVQRVSLYSAIA